LLRNLVATVGADRVAVVEPDPDRLEAARAAYGAVTTYSSFERALDDPEVGALVIATPVGTHEALTAAGLESGRHVLVEKPLCTSTAGGRRLVDLARDEDVVLMVGHTFIFSPRVRWISGFLDREGRDDLHYVTSSRLNLGIHRGDVNVIWDLAPHDFSVIFHLLQELPHTAHASARSTVVPDHPDVAFIDLSFPSGVIASVTVSWFAPRKVRNLMIAGDSAMVVYDDTDAEEPVKVHDRGVVVADAADFGSHQLTYRYGDTRAPHISVVEPLSVQLREFVSSVESGAPPASDGQFGLDVVAALEAADQSWRCGGAPVAVPSSQGTRVVGR
jgi:predicted dehydrogenase